jgi:hypothetical protein
MFLKKYGFRYHKNACHACDGMGHTKANCPERTYNGDNKKPYTYKKKFDGNFKKKYYGNNKKPYKKGNIEDVQCYNCQGKRHHARDCPQKKKFKNMFLGCVGITPKLEVKVSSEICSKHKNIRKHGKYEWQTKEKEESEDEGYLSADSEQMNDGEDVICIGQCWTCKEDKEMRK